VNSFRARNPLAGLFAFERAFRILRRLQQADANFSGQAGGFRKHKGCSYSSKPARTKRKL
jgi:hypothetical protein